MSNDPSETAKIPTIGLLGGVASGKSAVARCFERLGCAVLDGDVLGHEVLEQQEVIDQAIERWGSAVVDGGALNRKAIAERVFGRSDKAAQELAYWESVTHPRISRLLASKIAAIRNARTHVGVVVDAAVMLKAGWQKHCDFLVFVDAPEALRVKRAEARGWTANQLREREAAQASITEKRELAHFVVDNSGDLDQTYEEVVRVWQSFSS